MGLGLFCKNPNGCTHRNLVFSEENELVLGNQHVPYIEAFDGSAEVVIEFAAYVDILFFKGTRNVPLMKVLPRSFPFHYIVDNVEEITKDWKPQLSPSFLYESTVAINQFTQNWKAIENRLTELSDNGVLHRIIETFQANPGGIYQMFQFCYGFKMAYSQNIQMNSGFIPLLFFMNSSPEASTPYWGFVQNSLAQEIPDTKFGEEIFSNYFDLNPNSHHSHAQSLVSYGFFYMDKRYKGDFMVPLEVTVPMSEYSKAAKIVQSSEHYMPCSWAIEMGAGSDIVVKLSAKRSLFKKVVSRAIYLLKATRPMDNADAGRELLKSCDKIIEEYNLDIDTDKKIKEDMTRPDSDRYMAYLRMSDALMYNTIKKFVKKQYINDDHDEL
eukprot:TRINITY_DN392_c0_g1_i3.p1 TRINITY_DN392_c0_g1~~TRINITY_DN392_c0_g1_i3.p1  ORF type:complete len:383 (+),score=87.15 TRINITY_DN392_c0_g1_i3:109-1257(+)